MVLLNQTINISSRTFIYLLTNSQPESPNNMSRILVLFFFFLITRVLYSQCPTGDVYLNNQTDVANYIANFGTCDIIPGNLYVGNATDISGITAIKTIIGSLIINYSKITSVSNFSNLEFIGGDFEIDQSHLLETIEGIDKLQTVNGDFLITHNYSGLKNIKGFNALEQIGGNFQVSENYSLETISLFNNLLNVEGWFLIRRANAMEKLEGFNNLVRIGVLTNPIWLSEGNLWITENDSLIEINGFASLIEIAQSFHITQNSKLEKVIGFTGLVQTYGMNFNRCPLLIEIPQFDNLVTIGSGLEIWRTGLAQIDGFNNIQIIGDLNPSWGNLNISDNNNLISITGFALLNELKGALDITAHSKLVMIDGFLTLTKIRSLNIVANDDLTNLNGLQNLINVEIIGGSAISVRRNPSLNDCSALCDLLTQGTVLGTIYFGNNPSKCSSETEVREECIPDFDDDGVLDDDDLDDDNDGILDTVEQNGLLERDSDADGLPDHMDLDSDNDGCFDVIEAGFTDDDLNGTLGSLLDSVDANGLIIGEPDGYTIPLDANSDSIFDFQQANTLSAGENGSLEICINSSPVNLFDSITGTADTGGVWTPSLTSGTGIFDPSIDAAGIYTYTVTNGICGSDTSEVDVTIDVLPNAGENGNVELCINSASIDLFDRLTGSPDSGGVWTPSLTSGTGIFDPSIDAAGVYTYTVTNGICNSDTSEVDLTIDVLPNAGENGSLEICINSSSVDLFDSLIGTPDTGGVWTPSLTSGTGIFDPLIDVAGVYTYTVPNNSCGSDTSEVDITIDVLPNAGEDGNLEICINSSLVDLFDSLTGTPDTGGVWTPTLASGTGIFDPTLDAAGIYNYTVTNGSCGSATSEVNVSVDNLPNAGEDSILEICINRNSVDLFTSLAGTPDSGGFWVPSLASGTGVFDPMIDAAGIYTYTITSDTCGSDTSEINVSITNVTPIIDYDINIKEFTSNNSLEVIINANLEYEFSLDGINFQSSNVFNNLAGGDYTIYVQEINGCGILETMASILDYPKFFTPNNDGVNDVWKLKGNTTKNYSIYIFDRYGKLLKHLTSPESSWDGIFNGSQLPANDYWFKVVFIDGIVKSGHFTLKR
jgi:gliding motility-associated-like protein